MHEYKRRFDKALAGGLADLMGLGANHLYVTHDDWCGIHHDRECNCDPEITAKTEQGTFEVLHNGKIRKVSDGN